MYLTLSISLVFMLSITEYHAAIKEENSALSGLIEAGTMPLQHRVVLVSLISNRGNTRHTHMDVALASIYAQHGTESETLLISEAIIIVPEPTGRPNVPGIWSEEQVSI